SPPPTTSTPAATGPPHHTTPPPGRSAPRARSRVNPNPTAQHEGSVGVALGGTVGDMDVAAKPTGTYSRRVPTRATPTGPPGAGGSRGFGCVGRSYNGGW